MKPRLLFWKVPAMDLLGTAPDEAESYGDGNFVYIFDNTTKEDYLAYLTVLEKAGFVKYVDNADGLYGSVYTASYVLMNNLYPGVGLVLTATYVIKTKKTYISACEGLPLSDHLFYKEEYLLGNKEGAKTTLHMLEHWKSGNSFVIRLKNGHFLVCDGGDSNDLPYLLDYLEQLAPAGEKPVVEGWLITHAHGDHSDLLTPFITKPEYACRLFVEGIYLSVPNEKVIALDPFTREDIFHVKAAAKWALKTTHGTAPNIYRPQTGQRYYFNDITVDILVGQEQIPYETYDGAFGVDFNDSSTWYMITIDGQKCLFTGDADRGGAAFAMQAYEPQHVAADVYTLRHHGYNTEDYFTDFCSVKTVLATARGEWKLPTANGKGESNAYLRSKVEEFIFWGDGTKVLTFPYAVGSYETLPKREWIYHQGKERPN